MNDDTWFFLNGIRYCNICKSHRCKRQKGGTLICIPHPDHNTNIKISDDIMKEYHMNTLPPDGLTDKDFNSTTIPEMDEQVIRAIGDIEKKNFVRMVAGGLFINRSYMSAEECWIDAKRLWSVKPNDC